MTRTSASLFRLRCLVGTAATVVVLSSVGVPATARAEAPAPDTAPPSAPGDTVPVDVPTAPGPGRAGARWRRWPCPRSSSTSRARTW